MFYAVGKKSVLLVLGLLAAVLLTGVLSAAGGKRPQNSVVVVLDAGHGGMDGGVSGKLTKVKESDLNLRITRYLKEQFENAGMKTVLTREGAGSAFGGGKGFHKRKDMETRRKIAEESRPALLISIHLNRYADPAVRGAQVFFDAKNEGGRALAGYIQNSLNQNIEPFRPRRALPGDFYLLRGNPAAGVIVECGFLSSPEDEALLQTAAHQKKLAESIFHGALQFLTTQAVSEYR